MNREAKIFILGNLILLLVTQPGAIVWANWDAPYGFMRDLTTWISSFVGLSPVLLAYLILRRSLFGKKVIFAYIAVILTLAYAAYSLQQPLFEGFRSPTYEPNFLTFLGVGVIGGVLSIMLLPLALLHIDRVYLGYGYDLSLGLVNLTILLIIILLLLHTLRRSSVVASANHFLT